MDRRKGIEPDYLVQQSLEDLIKKKDTVVEYGIKLCKMNVKR